jgi:hypothetical protein
VICRIDVGMTRQNIRNAETTRTQQMSLGLAGAPEEIPPPRLK